MDILKTTVTTIAWFDCDIDASGILDGIIVFAPKNGEPPLYIKVETIMNQDSLVGAYYELTFDKTLRDLILN